MDGPSSPSSISIIDVAVDAGPRDDAGGEVSGIDVADAASSSSGRIEIRRDISSR